MIRRALVLGFFSIGGQVLLLRELVAALNGDELFIATALFGWLMAVALGAYVGGRRTLKARAATLFLVGAISLPLMMVAVRLVPLLLVGTPGQVIPFSVAAAVSALVMLPVGIISGWLFPSITRTGGDATDSIASVYLFEGIGAFAGGLAILFVVGEWFSALQAAVAMILVILLAGVLPAVKRVRAKVVLLILTAAVGGVLLKGVVPLEGRIDRLRYRPYEPLAVFDTHYGRQAVLQRAGELVLLTDNTVEAVYPQLSRAEDMLIPPLIYHPQARRVLYVGRPEFGIEQLADQIEQIDLVSIDPRAELSEQLAKLFGPEWQGSLISTDLVSRFASMVVTGEEYDVVIVDAGAPDTYKSSRFLTPHFMNIARLVPGGILSIPTDYDTDNHISAEERQLLSLIYRSLESSFDFTETWPGNSTLLMGCDSSRFEIPFDTIIARLDELGYAPQFVSSNYLGDRLSSFKKDRLNEALISGDELHTVERPLLPHHQAIYRAKSDSFDRIVMRLVSSRSVWLIAVPLMVALFFLFSVFGRSSKRMVGLFLYFVAGAVSLSLELISFYVFQSFAGSLYSVMAVLIGTFMLGLAGGTFMAWRLRGGFTAHLALVTYLLAAIIFYQRYSSLSAEVMLVAHCLFLLIVAWATGMLFVAATRMCYEGGRGMNQGSGYAVELVGSSAGALLATPILLPLLGLEWLLLGLMGLVVLAYIGLLIGRR